MKYFKANNKNLKIETPYFCVLCPPPHPILPLMSYQHKSKYEVLSYSLQRYITVCLYVTTKYIGKAVFNTCHPYLDLYSMFYC